MATIIKILISLGIIGIYKVILTQNNDSKTKKKRDRISTLNTSLHRKVISCDNDEQLPLEQMSSIAPSKKSMGDNKSFFIEPSEEEGKHTIELIELDGDSLGAKDGLACFNDTDYWKNAFIASEIFKRKY